jgi:predicted nucleic acid-binding Zn finger protein
LSKNHQNKRHYAENIVKLKVNDELLSLYIYMSRNGSDYLMSKDTCSCKSFLFNNVYRNRSDCCYHLRYLKNAIDSDELLTLYLNKEDFLKILEEIYSTGKSLKLRKALLHRNS